MEEMTKGRTDEERKAIASFVTGRTSERAKYEGSAECAKHPLAFAGALDGPRWNGWGADLLTIAAFSRLRRHGLGLIKSQSCS